MSGYLLWAGLILAAAWWGWHTTTRDVRARRRQDRADLRRVRAGQRRVIP